MIVASEAGVALPFPPIVFGLIAAVAFLALGIVTWSYRDVSSRHSQKWAENDSANGHH
jgi:hypothetical protein